MNSTLSQSRSQFLLLAGGITARLFCYLGTVFQLTVGARKRIQGMNMHAGAHGLIANGLQVQGEDRISMTGAMD